MKKTLLLVLLLLFSCTCFALTPEETLEKYYSSSSSENLDDFLSVLDTSSLSQTEIAEQKGFLQSVWDQVDNQEYSIADSRIVITEDGKTALVNYIINFSYEGPEGKTSVKDAQYVALLLKDSGDWKVAYAIPLENYLNLRNNMVSLKAVSEQGEILESEMNDFVGQDQKVKVNVGPAGFGFLGGIVEGLMTIGTIIVAGLIVLFVLSLFKKKKPENQQPENKSEEEPNLESVVPEAKNPKSKADYSKAMKILRKRYAKGEITTDEFNMMKKELES